MSFLGVTGNVVAMDTMFVKMAQRALNILKDDDEAARLNKQADAIKQAAIKRRQNVMNLKKQAEDRGTYTLAPHLCLFKIHHPPRVCSTM